MLNIVYSKCLIFFPYHFFIFGCLNITHNFSLGAYNINCTHYFVMEGATCTPVLWPLGIWYARALTQKYSHTQDSMVLFLHLHAYVQLAGFCPHWSEVVGPNHHSAIFTTTQTVLPPLTSQMLQQMYFYCILAKSLALGKPPLRRFWAEPWVRDTCVQDHWWVWR